MDRNTQTASATAAAVGSVASNFMLDAGTYQAAAEAGYGGMDFYFAGRAGVLGDASGSEVSDAVWLFEPGAVAAAWAASAAVESRASSAQRFASAAAVWADAHLDPDALDYDRLAELAGAVVSAADATGATLFAGWRDLPEPDDARSLALHRMNALRELRFARHRDALVDAGIEPGIATGLAVGSVELLEPVELMPLRRGRPGQRQPHIRCYRDLHLRSRHRGSRWAECRTGR